MNATWPLLAPDAEMLESPQHVRVGVVVTAHNVAPFLPAALESVFAQTRLPDEVVLCDDASDDDVLSAVEPYLDRVRVIRRPVRGGEGAAKNAAVAAMSADLVVILDGDDEMAPQRVEALVWVAERRPDLHLVTTPWEEFGPRVQSPGYSLVERFPVRDQRREILRWNFLPAPAIRRRPLLEAGGFDETLDYGPDWECYVRMFLRGAAAGLVPLPLYRYRQWGGQQTADLERVLAGRVRVAQTITGYEGLREDERVIAAGVLAEARFRRWAWRVREGRAARSEALSLACCAALSARQRAAVCVAVGAPRLARAVLVHRDEKVTGR
ncbi:glycosyltransferase family A protein [Geodermatophilus sp. SYSU D00698]